jgi:hypothetical protein
MRGQHKIIKVAYYRALSITWCATRNGRQCSGASASSSRPHQRRRAGVPRPTDALRATGAEWKEIPVPRPACAGSTTVCALTDWPLTRFAEQRFRSRTHGDR